jgi:hypothetical protein
MTISGFTIARNGEKYYYPIRESILSALPLVDEFIVALAEGDPDDHTRELLLSINSSKIKIYSRTWDPSSFKDGRILREETDFALGKCSGDWCLYLQADEVLHEADHPRILEACSRFLDQPQVDGFLFDFLHFWGDFDHVLNCHSWYQHDIRIIRNHAGIHSYKDAQSFRRGDQKLRVMPLQARIFHYGYARPPVLMQDKKKEQDSFHQGIAATELSYRSKTDYFDYGPLGRIPVYQGQHPAVMQQAISRFFWKSQLNYTRKRSRERKPVKHEKFRNRALTFLETKLLGGRRLWTYRNWILL